MIYPRRDSIRAVLAYFSIFNYPLTAFEIYKWLFRPSSVSLAEVYQALRESSEVAEQDGFFFLTGREQAPSWRLQTHFDNHQKVARAQRAARLVSWLPFWRMIAVTNTVAMESSQAGSDIDWLIIVKNRRLWTARFLITLWLWLFGQRRHGRQIANKICLSFFLTEDNLNLSFLALPQGDIYLTYWPTQLIPLLADEGVLEKFLEQNVWLTKDLPNFDFRYLNSDRRGLRQGSLARSLKRLPERLLAGRFGDGLERLLRRLQLVKMSERETTRDRGVSTSSVVISDQMLKFHEVDRRAEIYQKWKNLL